jgi:hypothetical protein
MDKKQFLIKLKQNITAIFNEIEDKEDVFEFGIFTDQDTSSLLIGYNTSTHFSEQLQEHFLESNRIVSHYRWAIPEWYECLNDDNIFVEEINDILHNVIQPKESKINPDNFKNDILDVLHKALLELKEEGLFNAIQENFILFLQQADTSVDNLMKQRLRKLMSDNHFRDMLCDLRFEFWRDTEVDTLLDSISDEVDRAIKLKNDGVG